MSVNTHEKVLSELVKLGLSNDASACYLVLIEHGSLNSSEIAAKMSVLQPAVYRLTELLESVGLIVRLNTHPMRFQAIPVDVALTSLVSRRTKELEISKTLVIDSLKYSVRTSLPTNIEIITGRTGMMKKYIESAKTATKEICIISIGESVTDDVKLVNRDAIERGVHIRFIVHTYDQTNEHIIQSYVRMGLDVRFMKDSGYHLMIFDGKISILSTNNPKNTEERSSMVIHSQGLSSALKNYFDRMWSTSAPVLSR